MERRYCVWTIVKLYGKTYCPAGGEVRIFVFAIAFGLMFLSVFVAIIGMLQFCICYVLDDLLCTRSEMTASGGRSHGALVSVVLSFTSSFSKVALLQKLWRHMYSAGCFLVETGMHIGGFPRTLGRCCPALTRCWLPAVKNWWDIIGIVSKSKRGWLRVYGWLLRRSEAEWAGTGWLVGCSPNRTGLTVHYRLMSLTPWAKTTAWSVEGAVVKSAWRSVGS